MQLMMQLSRRATTHENTLYNPCIVKVSREAWERRGLRNRVYRLCSRLCVTPCCGCPSGRESRAVLI